MAGRRRPLHRGTSSGRLAVICIIFIIAPALALQASSSQVCASPAPAPAFGSELPTVVPAEPGQDAVAGDCATTRTGPIEVGYLADGSMPVLLDLCNIYSGPITLDPKTACLAAAAGGIFLLADQSLYDMIGAGQRTPEAERWGQFITDLGNGATALGVCGVISLSDPETAYLGANAVIYSGIACAVLKAGLGRARPLVDEGPYSFAGPCIREGYNSMPSGHSATAFALATVLARQYPKYRVLFFTGATLVAISRVHEHAHWPSDALVGAAIGVWSANHVMTRSRILQVRW